MELLRSEEILACLEGLPDLPSFDCSIRKLQDCRRNKKLGLAKQMHAHVCTYGLEAHPTLGNYLVPMFVDCGGILDAHTAFHKLERQNEYSWTSLIQGYVDCGEPQHALNLYEEMLQNGVCPSKHTSVALLKACAMLRCMQVGSRMHAELARFEGDPYFGNALVDMYAKCGSMAKAQGVFDKLPIQDIVSWNALIAGYADDQRESEVLDCLEKMQLNGLSPDSATYVCGLKACEGLDTCLKIHYSIAKNDCEKDVPVASSLIDMYSKCGAVIEAQGVFDDLHVQGVVPWTSLISGYSDSGLGKEALEAFEQMQVQGVLPNHITYLSAMKACGAIPALNIGRSFHSEIIKKGFDNLDFVENRLVDMYAKCGSFEEAIDVFQRLPNQDVVSWTTLMAACTGEGHGEEALMCLGEIQRQGMALDGGVYICGLQACSGLGAIDKGRELHVEIVKEAVEKDSYIGSMIVDMYAKCGFVADAWDVLDELQFRDIVSWNALMTGFSDHGLASEVQICFERMQLEGVTPDEISWNAVISVHTEQGGGENALRVYKQMQEHGLPPNTMILVSVLTVGGNLALLETGRKIHSQICKGRLDIDDMNLLSTALIDMYGKCGSMKDAWDVFNIVLRTDLVAWNALLAGYARQGEVLSVLSLFDLMRDRRVRADGVTFLSILSVCSHACDLNEGLKHFECMIKEYDISPGLKHHTCVIDILGRAGRIKEAVAVVKELPFQPDSAIWCAVMGACLMWGCVELASKALDLALQLLENETAVLVLMSNIYADGQAWGKAS